MNSLQVTRAIVHEPSYEIFSSWLVYSGLDGLTPQRISIKDMTCDETNSLLIELIVDFVSLLLSGISDLQSNNIFYGGRFKALQKKSRGIID